VPGFALKQGDSYVGFDVDICRAVAVAVFADATKVKFVILENIEKFKMRGDVDLAVRRLTWTMQREEQAKVSFGPITFYDGQGFLVTRSGGIKSAVQLTEAPICVINNDRHPQILFNYLKDHKRSNRLVLVGSNMEAEEALNARRCEAYSADVSWLAAARAGFRDGLARYLILADTISKEPLAPMVRTEDVELARLIRWTLFAMIEAEEVGVSSRNIDGPPVRSLRVQRLLTAHPENEVATGADRWVRAIIRSVGNYGEMYERNLGSGSSLRLDRGLNRLWTDGGLIYALPLD
jgi:general L-amino acid transport system substrate-binding protein